MQIRSLLTDIVANSYCVSVLLASSRICPFDSDAGALNGGAKEGLF